MKFKSIVAAACVAALSTTPILAAPANSAGLSMAKSAPAAAPSKKGNKLAAPGAIIALIGAAAIIAGGVIIAVDDKSDSN